MQVTLFVLDLDAGAIFDEIAIVCNLGKLATSARIIKLPVSGV
jgi:hypothetical protein